MKKEVHIHGSNDTIVIAMGDIRLVSSFAGSQISQNDEIR